MAVKPPWFDPHMLVEATLQGYHLESLLGAVGFGSVYRTADTRVETRAAKLLYPPHSLGNEDMGVWKFRAINFGREAFVAASFRHPNIIRVFDTRQAYWHYQDPPQNSAGSPGSQRRISAAILRGGINSRWGRP